MSTNPVAQDLGAAVFNDYLQRMHKGYPKAVLFVKIHLSDPPQKVCEKIKEYRKGVFPGSEFSEGKGILFQIYRIEMTEDEAHVKFMFIPYKFIKGTTGMSC